MLDTAIKPLDKRVRVLPANIYDTLHYLSLVMGGVGKGTWFGWETQGNGKDINCPVCINGMAVTAGITKKQFDTVFDWGSPEKKKLVPYEPAKAARISIDANDEAVQELVAEGRSTRDEQNYDRVTWEDYVAKLNIVRGD